MPFDVDPTSDEGYKLRAKQGRTVPLVFLDIVDGNRQRLPHDGKAVGSRPRLDVGREQEELRRTAAQRIALHDRQPRQPVAG